MWKCEKRGVQTVVCLTFALTVNNSVFSNESSNVKTNFNFGCPEKENQYLISKFIYHVDLSFIFAKFYPTLPVPDDSNS